MPVTIIFQGELWSPCTNHVISCKEGGIEWASLKKSMLKKLQRSFFLFCLGVLWRLDISECGIAVQALLWTIQKIPVYVPVTALDEALCPTELTVCTDQGNRGLEGEKRPDRGLLRYRLCQRSRTGMRIVACLPASSFSAQSIRICCPKITQALLVFKFYIWLIFL